MFKNEKPPQYFYKRTLDIEFERDWSVGLGALLGDGNKENKKILISGIFPKKNYSVIIEFRMYYKLTKFDQNRWSYFSENLKF